MNREEKKKEELENVLIDWASITAEIACSKCNTVYSASHVGDVYEFADHLIRGGWTKRGNRCLCPKCSVKIKKS